MALHNGFPEKEYHLITSFERCSVRALPLGISSPKLYRCPSYFPLINSIIILDVQLSITDHSCRPLAPPTTKHPLNGPAGASRMRLFPSWRFLPCSVWRKTLLQVLLLLFFFLSTTGIRRPVKPDGFDTWLKRGGGSVCHCA